MTKLIKLFMIVVLVQFNPRVVQVKNKIDHEHPLDRREASDYLARPSVPSDLARRSGRTLFHSTLL